MAGEVKYNRRVEDAATNEALLRIESHEELCEVRYRNIESGMDSLKEDLKSVKETLGKVAWAILAGMAGILMKLFLGG